VLVELFGFLSLLNKNFLLALQGSVANKFYVHNDIFRYQDEVFGGFVTEPQEGKY
jgi:Ras GTPase-activating protein-binding protein 1